MRIPTSVTRILVVLGVFVFSSQAFSVTPEPETEKAKQSILLNRILFGVRIAGTYLVTRQPADGPSRISNIFADGNLTSIQSIQFGGGAPGEGFSNQHGTWKRVGKHKIEATVLDLSYDTSTGEFLGTTIAHYNLQFDNTLQTVTGKVKGKVFSPGVDPLNPGENRPTAEFSDDFQAKRVTVGN